MISRRAFLFGGVASLAICPALVDSDPLKITKGVDAARLARRAARDSIPVEISETIDILATMSPQWRYAAIACIDGQDWSWCELWDGAPNDKQIAYSRLLAVRAIQNSVDYRRRGVG